MIESCRSLFQPVKTLQDCVLLPENIANVLKYVFELTIFAVYNRTRITMQSSEKAEQGLQPQKIGVDPAEDDSRKDLEKWTISTSPLVVPPAALPGQSDLYS